PAFSGFMTTSFLKNTLQNQNKINYNRDLNNGQHRKPVPIRTAAGFMLKSFHGHGHTPGTAQKSCQPNRPFGNSALSPFCFPVIAEQEDKRKNVHTYKINEEN